MRSVTLLDVLLFICATCLIILVVWGANAL